MEYFVNSLMTNRAMANRYASNNDIGQWITLGYGTSILYIFYPGYIWTDFINSILRPQAWLIICGVGRGASKNKSSQSQFFNTSPPSNIAHHLWCGQGLIYVEFTGDDRKNSDNRCPSTPALASPILYFCLCPTGFEPATNQLI